MHQSSRNYQQGHLVATQEKLGEVISAEFCLRSISFILVDSGVAWVIERCYRLEHTGKTSHLPCVQASEWK
jgi:hypothetical protein